MTLFMRQFHNRPCAICGQIEGTVGHHLLPKGVYADYAFEEDNILVLCPSHPLLSNEIAAHSTSSLAVAAFCDWVQEHEPEKWAWMLAHKNKRSGKRVNYRDIYRNLDKKRDDASTPPCSTSEDFIGSFVKTANSS